MIQNNFVPANIYWLDRTYLRYIEVDAHNKKEKVNVFFPESGKNKYFTISFYEKEYIFPTPYIKVKNKIYPLISRYRTNTRNVLGYKEMMINNEQNRKLKFGDIITSFPAQTV